MKQDDQKRAQKLAFVNSVSENAYEHEAVARELLNVLGVKYGSRIRSYYDLAKDADLTVENIANSRNWIVKGAQPDVERTSTFILRTYRDGKMGKFILDEIEQ